VVVAEREGEVWRRVYLRGVRGECGPGLAARGRWESEEVLARKKQSCLDPGSGCEGAGDEHEGKRRREEQDRTEQSRGFLFFSFLLFFSSLGKRRCLHNVSGALLARISDQRTPRLGSTTSTDEPTESRMWMTQRGLRSASGGMRVQRSAIPCGTTDGRARATRCCTRPSEQDSRLLALWTVLGVSLLHGLFLSRSSSANGAHASHGCPHLARQRMQETSPTAVHRAPLPAFSTLLPGVAEAGTPLRSASATWPAPMIRLRRDSACRHEQPR